MAMAASINERGRPMTREERKVIIASSVGTVFEWYDFYLAGSLAANISATFFSGVNPTAAFIFTLLGFAAGFAVRPFGALFFGSLGDLIGRKYTFLVTMTLMGIATFVVGLLPSYAAIGFAAPVLFIACRLIQGLALGGEYGGAATYVAEHAPQQPSRLLHLVDPDDGDRRPLPLAAGDPGLRLSITPAQFADWGWRVPFLLSILLLGVSIWIRLQLQESPAFQRIKDDGTGSKTPLREAFGRWKNAKIAIFALLGGTAGQAVVWYCGQFYALFFLTQTLKLDGTTANLVIAVSLAIGTPFFIFFGWLSDKIGRKPIILAGCLLAVVTYFPLFSALTNAVNPQLEQALEKSPVDGDGRSERVLVPVQPDGHGELHHLVRHRQVVPRAQRGELLERRGACGHAGDDQDRRQGDHVVRQEGGRRRGRGQGEGLQRRGDRGDPRRRLPGRRPTRPRSTSRWSSAS